MQISGYTGSMWLPHCIIWVGSVLPPKKLCRCRVFFAAKTLPPPLCRQCKLCPLLYAADEKIAVTSKNYAVTSKNYAATS